MGREDLVPHRDLATDGPSRSELLYRLSYPGLLLVSDLDQHIHVIEVPCSLEPSVMQQKPPDYDTVADAPPCYEDAIKLSPSLLLANTTVSNSHHDQSQLSTPSTSAPSPTTRPPTYSQITSSSEVGSMGSFETSSNIHSASSSNSRQTISRLSHVTGDSYCVPGTPPPPYAGTRWCVRNPKILPLAET
jgi:hypothetical protein